MKLSSFLALLGFKRKTSTYGYRVERVELPGVPTFDYAHWLHPKVSNKQFQVGEFNEISKILSEGDFAIDIGAHIGDTTVPMGLAVGRTGTVLALEPNPNVFKVLSKNVELTKDLGHIVPLEAAAGEEDGTLEFEYSDPGYCNGGLHKEISVLKHGHAYKLKVNAINLPAYLKKHYSSQLDKLKYIKIDAEGYDYWIALSLQEILQTYRPTVQIEVFKHVSEDVRGQLHQLFSSLGYTLHHVEGPERWQGEVLTPADMSKRKHFDMLCVPA